MVVDYPGNSKVVRWGDKLPLVLILCWAVSAPVSIAVSQVFIGLSFAAVVFRYVVRLIFKAPVDDFHPFKNATVWLLIAIGVWVVTQIPSVLTSPDPGRSWFGFGQSDWLMLLCLAILWSGANDRWIIGWMVGLGISSSCAGLHGVWQHFMGWDYVRDEALIGMGPFFRAEGFFDFYLTFAGVQLGVLGLMIRLAFWKGSTIPRWYWWMFAVLIGLSLWATYGRGAWVGAMVALCVVALGTGGWKRLLIWVAGAAVVVAVIFIVVPEAGGRIGSVFQVADSGRAALWRGAIQMFEDHPITGIGIGRFQEVFPSVFQGGGYVDSFCHAHSDPLNRLAETGIMGVLGMVMMWGVLGWMGWKVWRERHSGIMIIVGQAAAIGLLGLWVAGWSQCYITDAEVGAVWWFMVGLLGVSFRDSQA